MIDPLRYRSLQEQLEYDENDSPMDCWQCLQERASTPAFFVCHDCGKSGASRPFCEPCFFDYHLIRRKGKSGHKPHPIVQGDPVIVQTLADGDGTTFAKMHDWVILDYTLTTNESDVAIDDTFLTKQPLTFQSGCSGPCIHLQLLGCTDVAAADIMGASDPYCAVYWKDDFVGATTTKYMTLNPKWTNQSFVLPLAAEFIAALDGDEGSSILFNASALLPKLRIELYDWDRLSKDDFLGQATVSDAELSHMLRQTRSGERDENHTLSFDFKPKKSRGQLGIRVALRRSKLYIQVMKAQNLPNADPFSLSDPYCEVYWNDEKIGETAHINDTLDPVWDLEIFSVAVDQDGPNSIEQSNLRIVCLDWDRFSSDDVLGQIELIGWQIKQLAESKHGDEVMSAGGGAMEEAAMEKVFAFMKKFQEHEMNEAELGKMVVLVPQDPDISKGHDRQGQVGEEAESFKDEKHKNKIIHEEVESGKEDFERGIAQPKETEGSCMEPVSSLRDTAKTGGDATELEAEVQVDPTDQRKVEGVLVGSMFRGDRVGEAGQRAAANEEMGRLSDQDRPSEVAETPRKREHENFGDVPVSGSVEDKIHLSEALGEGYKAVGSGTKTEEQHPTRRTPPPKTVTTAVPDSSHGIIGTQFEGAQTAANSQEEEGGVEALRSRASSRYRDATVERFEEDRGILVEYLDDASSAWLETSLIPRLQIRSDLPVTRSIFQSLWDQRKKLLDLKKRVLGVKRGLKLQMAMVMAGSRMQWYQLELTDEQSGANFVRGTVDCRFIYHTRGSVLRGLDVAVSHMSLGERARIEVRSDYGFGEVYASRNLRPYSTLVFVAQVAAIGHRSARWVVIRRTVKDVADDALFWFRSVVSSAVSSSGPARRLASFLGSLRNRQEVKEISSQGDEESLRNTRDTIEES